MTARAISIAILAMGGEGGGVLADWLVDLAEQNGFVVQATSVPGVAQRTGATIYYLEMFPLDQVPAGAQPVLALMPVPGEVDVVVASELMEAGRALQRGLLTAGRTTLVASTHRVYSMAERTAMGDGRVDSQKILAGARASSRQFVAADFAAVAEQTGSLISPVLYGALAACGALPFTREQFEATIRRGGVGVEASLEAFTGGLQLALGNLEDRAAPASLPPVGPRLAGLAQRIESDFPAAVQATLRIAIVRLADYQDIAYAGEYLDRLAPLRGCAPALLEETARHLALWMSYEDTIRVADLKTRRSRFDRVAGEVKLTPGQQLDIDEFMHPRVEEIADTLPAALGRRLLATRWARRCIEPFTRRGRVVRTSSLSGYLLLYLIASMRGMRRGSLRFGVEHQRIGEWLAAIQRLSAAHPGLALEVAKSQRLVKGYGDTHARGWGNFRRILAVLPQLQATPRGEQQLRDLSQAALADDGGLSLEEVLASVRIDGAQPSV
jgi:indolepyruvate ferredoxin oxidoreductase beta subunit